MARLKNPKEVIDDKDGKFGKPILLNLGGRGIRSMERNGMEYLIVAGRHDELNDSKLFRWNGKADSVPEEIPGVDFTGTNPEAMFFYPGGTYILSDDGNRTVNGKNCAEFKESDQQKFREFRGFRVNP